MDEVRLASEREPERVPVSRLRRAWAGSIPSTWITAVRVEGADLVLEGRGFGHGVGLCQYGARTLALAGLDHRRILEHFFPGAELAHAWPSRP